MREKEKQEEREMQRRMAGRERRRGDPELWLALRIDSLLPSASKPSNLLSCISAFLFPRTHAPLFLRPRTLPAF